MISGIGHFGLMATVLVAAGSVLAAVAAVRFQSSGALRWARWSIVGIAVLFTAVSGALLVALVKSDFQFEYVAGFTERALPLGYKIAAFWAGQEGSMLLWAWMLAVMCLAALPGFRKLGQTEHAVSVAVMGLVCGFFAAMLLFAADPFALGEGAIPADGRGLNPMLQNLGMIAHPPLLFLGYAGFTMPFAVWVGVLVAGRRDNRWLASIRRWLLVSWGFLTAGIVLGAWWAYVELGWGGYWAWDPVENASLLPWLTSTALLHSMMVQQHRGMFKIWNAVLIAVSFILCIFGTWLTRSGVISSVHAFEPSLISDFFLYFMGLCTVGSIGLMIGKRKLLRADHEMEGLISREGAFLAGNVLLTLMMVGTLVGTIMPLLTGWMTNEITVKQPYYNQLILPLGILLVGVMAMGPVLAFGKSAAAAIGRRLILPGGLALLATIGSAIYWTLNPWALVCVFVATMGTFAVVVGFLRSIAARRKNTGEDWLKATLRLIDRDHRRYGGQFTHLGLMLIVVGIAGSSLFGREENFKLRAGETAEMGRYAITMQSLDQVPAANYIAVQATVIVEGANGISETIYPQSRFYQKWGNEPNTEAAIHSTWREDLYVTVVGWDEAGVATALLVKINPLVPWIWVGGIIMTIGCLFSILPRVLPQPHRVVNSEPVGVSPAMPKTPVELEQCG